MILGGLVVIAVFVYARMTADSDDPERLFTYDDERIVESSGLAASARHEGIVYTHNDSDDGPYVFAVDESGLTRAVITLEGAEARDWEAIAVGRDDDGAPAVFVADIGDNLGGEWDEVWVYRFPEPRELGDVGVEPAKFRLTYEDGPRDAEAMLIDPRDNRVYIASKEERGGGLYRAPANLSADDVNVMERIADVPALITDGAFAPDGETFVLRDYVTAHVYDEPGHRLRTVLLPFTAQGEAITYTPDGDAWLIGSEGRGSAVWRVPVAGGTDEEPADAPVDDRSSTEPAPRKPAAGPPADAGDDGSLMIWGNAIALAAAGITIAALVRVIRRRRKPTN